MTENASFEFYADAAATIGDRLLVGYAGPGMASLVATDHLVTEQQTTQVGHIRAHNLPTFTTFNEGVPRYPSRLYTNESGPALLVSELFSPSKLATASAMQSASWQLNMESRK